MLTILLGYLIVCSFFIVERRVRVGQQAVDLERGPADRGSTALIGGAFGLTVLSVLAAPLLNGAGIGNIAWNLLGWVGVILAFVGVSLRIWAAKTLGRFYTRTLRILNEHSIVQEGPYQRIRHPGYLGAIVMWIGAALATLNWIAVVITSAVMLTSYYYRIRVEEEMLMASNAAYREYQARTWRLVPYLY